MQSVLNGPFHILLPIGKCEWDTISTRDYGNHFAISTLANKRVKRNHLRKEKKKEIVLHGREDNKRHIFHTKQ